MAERVLFVHAHPGDDALTSVKTIADAGYSVAVLTCASGDADDDRALTASLQSLGITDHQYLGLSGARWDGRAERTYSASAPGSEPVDTGALIAADPGEVAADIAAAILTVQPDVVVSFEAATGKDHPDSDRVHEATRTAASVLRVPLYVGAQTFSRRRPPTGSFSDYGIGARILTCVLALLLGTFTGATLTVAHQASVTVAGVPVPWGLIAGLIITAALIAGLRMVFETRIVAAIATLGLLGASGFLALQSAGGSILVPDNTLGYVWTLGPVIIAGVVLAWPRIRRSPSSNIGGTSAKGSVSL